MRSVFWVAQVLHIFNQLRAMVSEENEVMKNLLIDIIILCQSIENWMCTV